MAPRIRPHRSELASRGVRSLCVVLAAAAAMAIEVAPADSLSLPLETPTVPVKVPPVTVEVPPVTVKTPTVKVETPPVTVKVETPPVKTPTVPVKTPTVPVKTPTVPVKTPTVPVKTPTVPAKAPTINTPTVSTGSSKGPSVSVGSAKAPGVEVSTGLGKSSGAVPGRSGSGATASGSGATPPGAPSGLAGSGGNSGASSNTGAEPLATYGAGYGQLPAIEGAPGSKVRARIAARERNLKATVARERACLGSLPEQQEQLLVLRTGFGQPKPLSPSATAARLDVGSARFARLEAQALSELGKASAQGCAQSDAAITKVMTFLAAGFGGPRARGGVEAVRYEASPSVTPPSPTSGSSLLGVKLSSAAGHALLAVLALLVAALATALIVADAAGAGPRHERWRHQVRERVRAWR
jgi:hypothetical protein